MLKKLLIAILLPVSSFAQNGMSQVECKTRSSVYSEFIKVDMQLVSNSRLGHISYYEGTVQNKYKIVTAVSNETKRVMEIAVITDSETKVIVPGDHLQINDSRITCSAL